MIRLQEWRSLIGFPTEVDERSARVVALGVAGLAATAVVGRRRWPLPLLVYGFAARVVAGPRYSPLGFVATRVVTPRLPGTARMVPGAPKRLAQATGLVLSSAAAGSWLGLGREHLARTLLGVLLVAATLESVFGICLACKAFPYLVRLGVVDEGACRECSDITARLLVAERRLAIGAS